MELRTFCLVVTLPNIIIGAIIIIREERTKTITCRDNNVIDIIKATYEGRPLYCPNHDVTVIVQTKCQGRYRCSLKATDETYTDSCKMANEVLKVEYSCEEPLVTETQDEQTTYGPTRSPLVESTGITGVEDGCYLRFEDRSFYNGTTSVTKSGIECQRWDANTPHKPQYWPEGRGHKNFCRIPDGDERPWCYTVDPTKRWEYCNISQCVERNETAVDKETTVEPRTSMQNNVKNRNSTIAALIGACIVGLIVIAVIILAIFRRKFTRKLSDTVIFTSHSVDTTINQNGQQTTGYTNDTYQISCDNILDQTNSKTAYNAEYSYSDEDHLLNSGTLPPSYDVARKQNCPVRLGNASDGYNRAHYFEETYEIPSALKTMATSEAYSSPCHVGSDVQCRISKNETNVYENEHPGNSKQDSDNQTTNALENPYVNVECTKPADGATDGNQRYMPMTFSVSSEPNADDNVYVPIMSPTDTSSGVFDDSYRCLFNAENKQVTSQ